MKRFAPNYNDGRSHLPCLFITLPEAKKVLKVFVIKNNFGEYENLGARWGVRSHSEDTIKILQVLAKAEEDKSACSEPTEVH